MKNRIISGIVMVAIFIPLVYFGGIFFAIAASLIAALAYKELLDIKKDVNIPIGMKLVGLCLVVAIVLSNVFEYFSNEVISYSLLAMLMLIILAPTVFLTKYKYTVKDAFYLAFVVLFIGTIFNLIVSIFNESKLEFLFIIIVACMTDIFALVGGMLIGKHKLTPISPKKTIEGSITGTLISVIVSTTYYIIFISDENIIITVLMVMILSIVGQIGDLFFSLIKRENDKKDYSNLIPGHGGILDRIDSVIFILITYKFLLYFL